MNVLITGCSGFIGSHVAETFLSAGHTVIAPVRDKSLGKVAKLQKHKSFEVLAGSFHENKVLDSITKPVDLIIHLASIRGAGMGSRDDYKMVNTEGTRTLLNFAREKAIGRFIYISTVGVHGTIPEKVPTAATDALNADGYYHQTKLESEKLVLAANSQILKCCVIRPTITYGEGDDGFIPRMTGMVSSRRFILPMGQVKLHLLDVSAFASLMVAMADRYDWAGKTYIAADREPVSLAALVDKISEKKTGAKYPAYMKIPSFVFRSGAVFLGMAGLQALKTSVELICKDWYYDISDTEQELNFEPSDTLTAIERVIHGN